MKTYNLDMNDSFVHKRNTLISALHRELTGSTDHRICFAPPKRMLSIFGGNMDIHTFRSSFSQTPHMELVNPIEAQIPARDMNVDEKPSYDYKSAPVSNEPIKLKRSKPLKNSQNTLENTMGLFRSDS